MFHRILAALAALVLATCAMPMGTQSELLQSRDAEPAMAIPGSHTDTTAVVDPGDHMPEAPPTLRPGLPGEPGELIPPPAEPPSAPPMDDAETPLPTLTTCGSALCEPDEACCPVTSTCVPADCADCCPLEQHEPPPPLPPPPPCG
jgi:hypothetical protein